MRSWTALPADSTTVTFIMAIARCNTAHALHRIGEYPMRSAACAGVFAEVYDCGEHGRFYKAGESYYNIREQQIG